MKSAIVPGSLFTLFQLLCLCQSRDEPVHDDDINDNKQQIKNGGAQYDRMELMCQHLLVEEYNECLHGWDIEVLDVVGVVDGCEQLDASRLLVLLTDVLQHRVQSHCLDLDRFEAVISLIVLIELHITVLGPLSAEALANSPILLTVGLDAEAFEPLIAKVHGVARRVLDDQFVLFVGGQ